MSVVSEFEGLDVDEILDNYKPGSLLSAYQMPHEQNLIPEVETHVEKTIAPKNSDDEIERAEILKNGLQPKHLQIIALYLNGKGTTEIARSMGMSISRVSIILNCQKARDVIDEATAAYQSELGALMPRVLDAIREGLRSVNFDNKMKAVDRYIKLVRVERGEGQEDDSKVTQNFINLTVNMRERAFKELGQLAQRFETIEGSFEEVEEEDDDASS